MFCRLKISNLDTIAHSILSACASSAVRIYYTIELSHSKDFTYYTSVQALWSLPEMTLGLLAMCLPVSPKFFQSVKDSSFWSSLGSSLHFFSRPYTEAIGIPSTYPDECKASKVAKGDQGSNSFQAILKKHKVPLDENENEPRSTAKDGSSDQSTRNDHLGENHSPHHITRTTQIEITNEDRYYVDAKSWK